MKNMICNDNFYCSVPGRRIGSDVNPAAFCPTDFAVAIVRSFSAADFWDEHISSVPASRSYTDICFSVKAGVSAYLFRAEAALDLVVTVSAFASAPKSRGTERVRFLRHRAPQVRRTSCGHLSRKCTAFTL